jgi:hypothetical protein
MSYEFNLNKFFTIESEKAKFSVSDATFLDFSEELTTSSMAGNTSIFSDGLKHFTLKHERHFTLKQKRRRF